MHRPLEQYDWADFLGDRQTTTTHLAKLALRVARFSSPRTRYRADTGCVGNCLSFPMGRKWAVRCSSGWLTFPVWFRLSLLGLVMRRVRVRHPKLEFHETHSRVPSFPGFVDSTRPFQVFSETSHPFHLPVMLISIPVLGNFHTWGAGVPQQAGPHTHTVLTSWRSWWEGALYCPAEMRPVTLIDR